MKKFLLSAISLFFAINSFADYYMVGANVNGQEIWEPADFCKFTQNDTHIYTWEGELLGTGFKINNGSWSDPNYNIGTTATAPKIENGKPYTYVADSFSSDFHLEGATEIKNPKIVLNELDKTITVTGDFGGTESWYICGLNGEWIAGEGGIQLKPTEEEGVLKAEGVQITISEGVAKIASTNWATLYGSYDSQSPGLDPEHLTIGLEAVAGEAGNFKYNLPVGLYDFVFDINNLNLTVNGNLTTGIDVLAEQKVEAAYYTLQGVKVIYPVPGIYVKVTDNRAEKVILK